MATVQTFKLKGPKGLKKTIQLFDTRYVGYNTATTNRAVRTQDTVTLEFKQDAVYKFDVYEEYSVNHVNLIFYPSSGAESVIVYSFTQDIRVGQQYTFEVPEVEGYTRLLETVSITGSTTQHHNFDAYAAIVHVRYDLFCDETIVYSGEVSCVDGERAIIDVPSVSGYVANSSQVEVVAEYGTDVYEIDNVYRSIS